MKIIQLATGAAQQALLRVAMPRHTAYCNARGFAYVTNMTGFRNFVAVWDKIDVLLAELKSALPGETVLWIDADAWIEKTDAEVSTFLPAGADLALASENGRFASGVLAAKNSQKVIDFLTAFKAAPREPGYPLIDRNLSAYLKTDRGVVVANLDKTQHDWPYRFGPRPLAVFAMDANFAYAGTICGLHGVPKDHALTIMQQRLG